MIVVLDWVLGLDHWIELLEYRVIGLDCCILVLESRNGFLDWFLGRCSWMITLLHWIIGVDSGVESRFLDLGFLDPWIIGLLFMRVSTWIVGLLDWIIGLGCRIRHSSVE